MKKNYGLFIGFVVVVLAVVGYCIFYVFGNVGAESYTFNKDGYALYSTEKNNYKAESYSFTNGSTYSYKKSNSKITFNSTENGNVSIDDSTVVHYTDNSLLVLKNVVGLDLTTINNDIIFYYNIYKNTNINYDNGGYSITSFTGEKINFKNVLIRVSDNKYLFVSDSIRATVGKDEVIDFGNYAYIEYTDGNVVAIYNNTKTHQSISDDISLVSGEITINISDKTIAKEGEKYITLSNLVIDSNANIDLIPQEEGKLPNINKPNVDTNISAGDGGSVENNGSVGKPDNNVNEEVVEEEGKIMKQPVFKVVNMAVSPIKIDAELEINDEDSLIVSPTEITIVNNSTLEQVFETSVPAGDTSAFISTANLSPDTEYTIYAKATYKIDKHEYTRSFVNKIFRTKAIGVSFRKSYATTDSIIVEVNKENYSAVSSLILSIYTKDGGRVTYQGVDFSVSNRVEVPFEGLTNNTEYVIVMHDILCDGVSVEEGYSEQKSMYTLKNAPVVGELLYEINKRTSTFNLSIKDVEDPDYGIIGYRYEIFRVDQNMNTELPLLTFDANNLKTISVNVDENKLNRGSAYTYRVVILFNDNEKTIEYVKELGSSMQMDGVEYPKIRFEKSNVTWEQINGTIIIDDQYDTIVGDDYRVVYKNSVDVFKTNTIFSSTSEDTIPIAINGLRANESYTFQVYADVNLKDGNPTIDEAYIGSVVVQTGLPQQIQATYSTNMDYSSPFSVNVRLSSLVGQNANLEASTISEMTLTLYQGTGSGGSVEVYKKVIDKYDEDYQSSIKELFYDSQAVVNPAFFGASNSDFTQKSYTLKISNVYDYTEYKNEIPLAPGTDEFPFQTNSYVPDVPTGDSNAINVTSILNKNATVFGLEYDPNLLPNTVVGYNLVSNYPNDAKNAINMIYHVWIYNPETDKYEILPELDKVLAYDENGQVSNVVYPVGYGTSNDIFDTDMLRRGNQYYFSYEVELDLDGDGQKEEINYPAIHGKDIILKSANLTAEKEMPVYKMYPSVSTSNTATWKYLITDVDQSSEVNKLYSFVSNNDNSSSALDVTLNAEDYNSITFTKLQSNNFYSIKSFVRTIKSKMAKYMVLSTQYLYPITSSLNLTFSAKIDSNILKISINDYESHEDLINLISGADITISPDKATNLDEIKLSNVSLINGVAYVDLINYAEYMNKDLTISMKVYFDSGNTGFDVTSNYKAIQVLSLDGSGNYFNLISNKFGQTNQIMGNAFTTTFNPLENLIKATNNGSSADMNISIDERGVMYSGNPIAFKELKEENLSSDDNIVNFDLLVPSISLMKENGNDYDITPLLTSAIFKADLKLVSGLVLENSLIHVELFETDENGRNPVPVNRFISFTIENMKDSFTINELTPQTNYMAKFYANICDSSGQNCKKYYLYDKDERDVGVGYTFHTLSNVGIKDISANFIIESYEKKSIRFNYSLESIIGFSHISYKLYEYVDGNFVPMDIELPISKMFNYDMSFTVDASVGNEYGFAYGKTYKLEIIPVGTYKLDENSDEEYELDLGSKSHVFTLDNYIEPQVSITASKTDSSIFFRVNIKDTSKLINGTKYSVKLKNIATDEVVDTISNIDITSNTAKYTYTADEHNLEYDESYMLIVEYMADYNNSGQDLVLRSKTKSIHFGASVSLGAVTATRNATSPYAIDVIFADSYLLDTIDTVAYTVSSTTTDYFSAGENQFTLKYNADTDIYTHVINVDQTANFKVGNVYTITMNFFTGTKLVGTEEVSYYYAANTGGGE